MGNTHWASKRAQWAKVLATKPEDRSSIPGPTTQKLVSDLGRNAVYERGLHGGACEWRTEELVISFHLGGPRDRAQVHHLPISPALRYQLSNKCILQISLHQNQRAGNSLHSLITQD